MKTEFVFMRAGIFLFCSAFIFLFTACPGTQGGKSTYGESVYTIKFSAEGGNAAVEAVKADGGKVKDGEKVKKDTVLSFSAVQKNSDFKFENWTVNGADKGSGIPLIIKVQSDLTVKAVYKNEKEEELKRFITSIEKDFVSVPVPQTGISFPIGIDDEGNDDDKDSIWGSGIKTGEVMYPFEISKFELSYGIWYAVKEWGKANGYTFANEGLAGSDKGEWNAGSKIWANEGVAPTEENKMQPVTMLSFCDLIVWCNALNEMTGNAPVYYKDSSFTAVLKNAGKRKVDGSFVLDENGIACHRAKVKPDSGGFRLLTSKEWELAAKLQGTADKGNSKSINQADGYLCFFTKGNSASGASAAVTDASATGKVAWYRDNSGNKTHNIGELKDGANALGLFDMSGNVWELCFTAKAGGHIAVGGSFDQTGDNLRIAYSVAVLPEDRFERMGFRLARGKSGEVINNPAPSNIEKMVSIPVPAGGISFKTGITDDGEDLTVTAPFKIAEYETAYKLWKDVMDWAKTQNPPYKFINEGNAGGGAAEPELSPVVNISWHDVIVWCNAYSEKMGKTPVYYKEDTLITVLKDASQTSALHSFKTKPGANGFRLPSSAEWELAARLRTDNVNSAAGKIMTGSDGKTYYFTKGHSVSGAALNYSNEIETSVYSCNKLNHDGGAARIGTKKPNDLGIFDMSGNVWEWTSDIEVDGSDAIAINRGGGWLGDLVYIQLGLNGAPAAANETKTKSKDLGFRVCTF